MGSLAHNSRVFTAENESDTLVREADPGRLLPVEEAEKMARRRYQQPQPKRAGKWWYLLVRQDQLVNGKQVRKRKRIKLAPATMLEREAKKVAAEVLRPMNQGLAPIAASTTFDHYVETVYQTTLLPIMAKSTRKRYEGIIRNYLKPAFESKPLRDLTPLTLQQFFASLPPNLSYESRDKIRDVLSSILASAVKYGSLVKNPVEGVRLAPGK